MLPDQDNAAADDRGSDDVPGRPRQEDNPQLDFALRYLSLILAGVFFGSYLCCLAVARVLSNVAPERFEGGQGFALNAPAMMPGLLALFSFWCAFAMLILIHVGRWRSLARIPNPLTILLLLPGMWVILKILWLLISRFAGNFSELFRDV